MLLYKPDVLPEIGESFTLTPTREQWAVSTRGSASHCALATALRQRFGASEIDVCVLSLCARVYRGVFDHDGFGTIRAFDSGAEYAPPAVTFTRQS